MWVIHLKNGSTLFLLTVQGCFRTTQVAALIGDFPTISISEGGSRYRRLLRKNLQTSMSLGFIFKEVFENKERGEK